MSTHAPNGTPFCWIPKAALAKIEQELELSQAATAKLVYMALCRVACDERKATFSKPIAYLATLASVERRTVERRLPDLERLELVTITRGTLHVPHTFALPTLSRNDATESRNDATGRDPQRVALSREVEKERRGRGNGSLSIPERIDLRKKQEILTDKLRAIKEQTSELWQQDTNPGLVAERKELEAQLKAVEAQILNA